MTVIAMHTGAAFKRFGFFTSGYGGQMLQTNFKISNTVRAGSEVIGVPALAAA